MVKRIIFILLTAALLFSCQSNKAIKRASKDGLMYAMIYDYSNTPVTGVTVYLNKKKVAESDIQGRFVLDKSSKGEYTIRLVKKGYENLEEKFHFDPLQVLYFKMIDTSQLITLAETALDKKELKTAENYIERALVLEPNRPDILYLKSITLYLQEKNEEAVKILERLVKTGNTENAVIKLLETIQKTQE